MNYWQHPVISISCTLISLCKKYLWIKFCRKCSLQCQFILWRPTWMKALHNHVRSNHAETNYSEKSHWFHLTWVHFNSSFLHCFCFSYKPHVQNGTSDRRLLSSDIALWFPTSHIPAKCARNVYELCCTRSSSFNAYLIKINILYAYMEFDILFGI